MFYRTWNGLPKDPHFPSDLKELGYFVHESDQIRSIENPDNYFKFFSSRNMRHNERQRYAMNEAIEKEVHARFETLGLKKTLLPLGTTNTSQPHVPILVSHDIKTKSRVVVIIGETYQDLGILAHRSLGGRGGVDKGSMVSVVRTLQSQRSSPDDPSPPGLILANAGQLVWMPQLGRSVALQGADGAPRPSAVHAGIRWDAATTRVPGNGDVREHIGYIFEKVVPAYVDAAAAVDVVAIGDGADNLERYLDWAPTFERLAGRLNCLAIVGGYYAVQELRCEGLKQFLREKTRAYTNSTEPLGTPISGPDGNPNTVTFTSIGCPIYSGGEPCYVETLLIACLPHLADWLTEVTLAGRGRYTNPVDDVQYRDPVHDIEATGWGNGVDGGVEDVQADGEGQGNGVGVDGGSDKSPANPTEEVQVEIEDGDSDEDAISRLRDSLTASQISDDH